MIKKFSAIGLLLYSALTQAAPFEIKVHDEVIAKDHESVIEIQSVYFKPSAENNPVNKILLTRMEYAYGIRQGSEVSFNLYTSRQGNTTYINGGKLAHMYFPPHDENGLFHYGIKNEYNFVKMPNQADQSFYEITPILAFHFNDFRLTLNPSIDYFFSGNIYKTTFSPAYRLAYELSNKATIAVEYYAEMGPIKHFTSFKQRPDTAYLVFEKEFKDFDLQIGAGRGLHQSSDAWVLKLTGSLSF
jgi:hypothetical protein